MHVMLYSPKRIKGPKAFYYLLSNSLISSVLSVAGASSSDSPFTNRSHSALTSSLVGLVYTVSINGAASIAALSSAFKARFLQRRTDRVYSILKGSGPVLARLNTTSPKEWSDYIL